MTKRSAAERQQSKLTVLARNNNFLKGRILGYVKNMRTIASLIGREDLIVDIELVKTKLLATCDVKYREAKEKLTHGTSKAEEDLRTSKYQDIDWGEWGR